MQTVGIVEFLHQRALTIDQLAFRQQIRLLEEDRTRSTFSSL
jgi:hypothetical protein